MITELVNADLHRESQPPSTGRMIPWT
jgi:hypothetical protein